MDDRSRRVRRPLRSQKPAQDAAPEPEVLIGASAAQGATRLRSFQVGALPLVNQMLQRLQLEAVLGEQLPDDDVRQELPTARLVSLLVRNVLVSREPLYGVGAWVARYSPDLFDLFHCEVPLLHDDRLGACLARLYTATTPELILAVVRSAIREFDVSLDELHNDSTTVSFHGEYRSAEQPLTVDGHTQPAITWGHSKDHRPDLKQLLFTLTVTQDGGVPVYFGVDSGNTTDDTTHRQTWDLLCELVGRTDFLYIADCKLANRENLQHIAARGGRFITVLPATRREDGDFRRRLRAAPAAITWTTCWVRTADPDPTPQCDRDRTSAARLPDDVIQVSTAQVTRRCELTWRIEDQSWNDAALDDGVFPLLTNDRTLTPREVLEAYKRQPTIEKRFSQLKSDFAVAPVFLKSPARVLGLFTVYFLALLVQALLERELRRALQRAAAEAVPQLRHEAGSIDLYPEGRRTKRPTARRALDALEPLRRYELSRSDAPADQEPLLLFDDLTPTQQRLLSLLGMNLETYGR